MIDGEKLVAIALESNASHAAVLETSKIEFHEDFRAACEKNTCGKYNATWSGPPIIGPIKTLIQDVVRFRCGLLFQTLHRVASSFDMKGMFQAGDIHDAVFRDVLKKIRVTYPEEELLPLDKGCCSICPKCAYLDKEPCRNPDEALSSVEAYGMNVIALQKSAGLPYYGGKNTVLYVGLILFNKSYNG